MKTTEAYVIHTGAAERDLYFTRSTVGHRTIKTTDGRWFTMVDTYDGSYVCADCLFATVDRMTDGADAESDDYAASDRDYGMINGLSDVFIFGTDDPYGFVSVQPMPDDHYDGPVTCDSCSTWLAGDLPADYLQACLQAYLACLIWTGLDWADATGPNGDPRQLDETYDVDDIPSDVVTHLSEELQDFLRSNWSDVASMDPEQVGHDFCLSRNGHGTGFWDRGDGERGRRLHEATKPYGSLDLQVADDGSLFA
jgi:hypothetical protein